MFKILCLCSYFSIDRVHEIVVEKNCYAKQFMNSRETFTFRTLVRPWTPATGNEMLFLVCICSKGSFKISIFGHFSRNRILPTPGFVDVISKGRSELVMNFLHFADNTNKANYKGPAKLENLSCSIAPEQ
jgi:hypothetical protein